MDIVKPTIPQRFLTNGVRETWQTDRIQALRKRHELGSGWNKVAQADLEWLLERRERLGSAVELIDGFGESGEPTTRRVDLRELVCAYELRLCFKDLFDDFHAEATRTGFVAEEVDVGAFLDADQFELAGIENSRPVAPSSGNWASLRLFVFRRMPGFV